MSSIRDSRENIVGIVFPTSQGLGVGGGLIYKPVPTTPSSTGRSRKRGLSRVVPKNWIPQELMLPDSVEAIETGQPEQGELFPRMSAQEELRRKLKQS